MGYLDNSSITVDAVLTKKGRELLKSGGSAQNGSLRITSFTLSDTGVDYTLWNPSHPSGSAFYGEAIENLPQLEASVHSEYNLRNRLLALPQDSSAMPSVALSPLDASGIAKTVGDADPNPTQITIDMIGYTPSQNLGYNVLILDTNVVSVVGVTGQNVSGTSRTFLGEQDIRSAIEYQITGNSFNLEYHVQSSIPQSTTVYVVDVETGAYQFFTAINNRLEITRAKNRAPIGS